MLARKPVAAVPTAGRGIALGLDGRLPEGILPDDIAIAGSLTVDDQVIAGNQVVSGSEVIARSATGAQTEIGALGTGGAAALALGSSLDAILERSAANEITISGGTRGMKLAGVQVGTFTDTGSVDFFPASQATCGLWCASVFLRGGSQAWIGSAILHFGHDTANGFQNVAILSSGVNAGGVAPVFSVQNNDTATGRFRVATASGTGIAVGVFYRPLIPLIAPLTAA